MLHHGVVVGAGAHDHAVVQHGAFLDQCGGMDARLGGIEPAATVQPRRRQGIGRLRLLGDHGQATRRQRRDLGGCDEAGPGQGSGKVGLIAAVGEEARGLAAGLGQRRDHPEEPSGVGALAQPRAGKRRELACRDRSEILIETRIRHETH